MTEPQTLLDACQDIMSDSEVTSKYRAQGGMTSINVLEEIRLKFGPDAFPLCTWIDVHKEMSRFYGPGTRHG